MRIALLLLALAGCSEAPPGPAISQAQDLETAAIERGLIRAPSEAGIEGLYARDTDRLCIVGDRIGASVDYGDGIACSAAGTIERAGERLRVTLGQDCAFDARHEGARVIFPATVHQACRRFCTGRASFAALDVERLSDSTAEAAAMRDVRGRTPCRG